MVRRIIAQLLSFSDFVFDFDADLDLICSFRFMFSPILLGNKINRNDKNIPAHLLGNMWAQSWVNLYERIKPFKNASELDITALLQRNNFTAFKIFKESDRFYQSLGLESNEMSYTGKSIIEKPSDRLIVCHASAWVCIVDNVPFCLYYKLFSISN